MSAAQDFQAVDDAELAYAQVVAAKLRCGIEVPRANVVEALLYAVPAPDSRLPQASAPRSDLFVAAASRTRGMSDRGATNERSAP